MTAYPDTSFLYGFYIAESNSPAAAAYAAMMREPLHVTELLRYEFRQSLRFQVWRRSANPRDLNPVGRITPAIVALDGRNFDAQQAALAGISVEKSHCAFQIVDFGLRIEGNPKSAIANPQFFNSGTAPI